MNREPKATGEVLAVADGLDWKTMLRCNRIYLLPKERFDDQKGSLNDERRHLFARKMMEVLRLPIHRKQQKCVVKLIKVWFWSNDGF